MAGLSFDSKSNNSAFLSAGMFSADLIADLVFSMCSSVIYGLPSISLSDLWTRWNGTRLKTTRDLGNIRCLLPNLFRFCSEREPAGKGIEDFRVPERPSIINRYSLKAPLVVIADQVAIVA